MVHFCFCPQQLSHYTFPLIPLGFLGGAVVKNLPAQAGDMGLIPGPGNSPGEGNGNPLQYTCLKDPMYRGAQEPAVQRVAKSQTAELN